MIKINCKMGLDLGTLKYFSLVSMLILMSVSGCISQPSKPIVTSGPPSTTTNPTPKLPVVTALPTETPIAPTQVPTSAALVETTVTLTIPTTTTTLPSIQKPSGPAEYRLTFKTTWSNNTHPKDFPDNPHFSGLIGAAHKPNIRLWMEGELATPGIEAMAEDGVKPPFDIEIESLIAGGGACANISGGGVSPSPGMRTVDFAITPECTFVSVVSMIAPSPDWFVGVTGLDLNDNGAWIDEIEVDLPPYDAGTDLGSTYTSPDEPAEKPVEIRMIDYEPLLVDGNVPPMGTFTFTRLDS
jgi:hypothetical protein